MKWVEIIQVRSLGKHWQALMVELSNLAASKENDLETHSLKIYKHAAIEGDHLVVISGESEDVASNHNTPGVHLVYLLKEFAMVDRSLWVETD